MPITNTFPQHVYLYTDLHQPDRVWRVVPALLISLHGNNVGKIVFPTNSTALHVLPMRHITDRFTAEAWVLASDFETLAHEIEEDYKYRHLWHDAYQDVQRIRQQRTQTIVPAIQS